MLFHELFDELLSKCLTSILESNILSPNFKYATKL
jgi:hypothetical protein